jgi:phosphohistidine phosphatase SixA
VGINWKGNRLMAIIIDVLRHANAEKKPDIDRLRDLSDIGECQAEDRRRAIWNLESDLLPPSYDLVFASPTVRTKLTAAKVANTAIDNVVEIPELHWESNPALDAAMEVMFKKLGYAKPSDFDKEEGGRLIREQNQAAWTEIWGRIVESRPERVLVVGHAVMTPGLGQVAATGNAAFFEVLDLNLSEAGGYRLTVDSSGNVTGVEIFDPV